MSHAPLISMIGRRLDNRAGRALTSRCWQLCALALLMTFTGGSGGMGGMGGAQVACAAGVAAGVHADH